MLAKEAPREQQLVAGYTLLVDLLRDEARVDGILLLKDLPEPTERLVRRIADQSSTAVERLVARLDQPPRIQLVNDGLPLIEVEARARIRGWTTTRLLAGRGVSLECSLIVSQLQAVDGIRALADALREEEPDQERTQVLDGISATFGSIRTELQSRLEQIAGSSP